MIYIQKINETYLYILSQIKQKIDRQRNARHR